ncbi:MAG: VOC family protein [Mycobacteriales bacterium]
MSSPGLRSIVVDCARPHQLARFWAVALGYTVRPYDDAEVERLRAAGIDNVEDDPSVVIDPPDHGPTVWFNLVPEPKAGKNRVHLDVDLTDAAELERLVTLGATVLRPWGAVPDEPWAILADPEGNEFCAFPPA